MERENEEEKDAENEVLTSAKIRKDEKESKRTLTQEKSKKIF